MSASWAMKCKWETVYIKMYPSLHWLIKWDEYIEDLLGDCVITD
jgi:hypothetical protein